MYWKAARNTSHARTEFRFRSIDVEYLNRMCIRYAELRILRLVQIWERQRIIVSTSNTSANVAAFDCEINYLSVYWISGGRFRPQSAVGSISTVGPTWWTTASLHLPPATVDDFDSQTSLRARFQELANRSFTVAGPRLWNGTAHLSAYVIQNLPSWRSRGQ